MQFLSLDIKIGTTGVQEIRASQQEFHEKVAKMLFPETTSIVRLGMQRHSPIDHRNYVHNPGCIKDIIEKALSSIPDSPDLCIVDFTSNPFVYVRDPLLISLAESIIEACKSGSCNTFVILLPKLPGPHSASSKQFQHIKEELKATNYTVMLIPNSGNMTLISSEIVKMPEIQNEYSSSFKGLYGEPAKRLDNKCIRRLGHFRSRDTSYGSNCRHFSYYLDTCEAELRALFSDWWREFGGGHKAILFDLKNNPYFRNIVKAFGSEHAMITERIVDVLENKDLRKAVMQVGPCVLVLDVVDTGGTMLGHVGNLQKVGVQVSSNILTAINKGSLRRTFDQKLHVHGFLSRPSESENLPCIQCKLKLRITPEAHEPSRKIRSYDMLHIAVESGFEPEPQEEVPANIGKEYPIIPNFTKALEQFGDWVAFKIFHSFLSGSVPDDWFIIHPEEAGSTAISDRLQTFYENDLYIVKVPRGAIMQAQSLDNSWAEVITAYEQRTSHEKDWVDQLRSVKGKGAAGVILDIFNGSGSTCKSIESLLNYFNVDPFCYFCFVDFDPAFIHTRKSSISKFSLYDWYNPRVLMNGNREEP